MMKRTLSIVLSLLIIMTSMFCSFTVFAETETVAGGYEIDMDDIPKVHFEDHPEWEELYNAAWNFHKGNIRQVQNGLNPELTNDEKTSYYVDEAFDDSIFQWDTLFMMMFDKYGINQFPTLNSMDNFYYHQIDSDDDATNGYICRRIGEANGNWYYSSTENLDGINPPLFAWAEWEQYLVHGDVSRFTHQVKGKAVIDRLDAYYQFIKNNRRNSQGLYVSTGQGNGLDNTPNQGGWSQSANDMSLQQVQAADYIVKIAKEIVDKDKTLSAQDVEKYTLLAEKYEKERDELKQLIQDTLWSEEGSFFFNTNVSDGSFTNIVTPTGLWSLAANVATPEQAEAMINTYALNSEKLFRPNGLSTVTYDFEGGWQGGFKPTGGYWNGAMWSPTSYQWIKGLQQYGYDQLAMHEAIRHIDALSDVYQRGYKDRYGAFLNTIWENYSSEYTKPGSTENSDTQPSRTNFVGWTGALAIASMIEDVVGVTLNAPDNEVNWNVNLVEEHGISNLYMCHNGVANRITLKADRRVSASSELVITVTASQPFTLNVTHNGITEAKAVEAGTHTYKFNGTDGEEPVLSSSVKTFSSVKAALSKSALDESALDYVMFSDTDNNNVNDGLKKQTTKENASEKIYNVNTIGFSSHEMSVNLNPPTVRENSAVASLGFEGATEYVKTSHSYGEEGFMAMATADNNMKTLKVIVGAENCTAKITANVSDASSVETSKIIKAGPVEEIYVIEFPYRAASDGNNIFVEYIITEDAEGKTGNISLKGLILEDGGVIAPEAPQNVTLTSSDGAVVVDAEAGDVQFDSWKVSYGTTPGTLDAVVEAEDLPVTIDGLTNYTRYYFSVSGVIDGVESSSSEILSQVPEKYQRTDKERALADFAAAETDILNGNDSFENIRSSLNFDIEGAVYQSEFKFNLIDNAGVISSDGTVTNPIEPEKDVQCILEIEVSCGSENVKIQKALTVKALKYDETNYVSGKISDVTDTVDLTEDGTIDWIQFNTSSVDNFIRKNTGSAITNIKFLGNFTNQRANDMPIYFTASDGTGTPQNRTGIVAKNVDNGFSFNLPSSADLQKVKVYTAVWSAGVRLELRINGKIYYTDSFENTSDTTLKCFEIDYRTLSLDDEVQIKLYMTDSYNSQWGGSLILPAVTLSASEYVAPVVPEDKNVTISLTGQPSNVDLTSEGTSDWIMFNTTNLENIESKLNGDVISNVSAVNSVTKMNPNPQTASFSYSDGTNSESGNSTNGIVFEQTGNGIEFDLSYSENERTVKAYVGSWSADVCMEASTIRDGEVVDVETLHFDTGVQAGGTPAKYTIFDMKYKLESPDDTLHVKIYNSVCHDSRWGNMNIAAVTVGEKFDISVDGSSVGGDIYVSKAKAAPGETVEVFTIAEDGMKVSDNSVRYVDSDGTEIEVTNGSFIMPNSDVTIKAQFENIVNGIVSVEIPDEIRRNDKFEFTVITAEDHSNLVIRNSRGNKMGASIVSKSDESDGTFKWIVRMSIGTAGSNREFGIYDGNGDLLGSFTCDVLNMVTGIKSVAAPESAKVNEAVDITVVQTDDLYKNKIINEKGNVIKSSIVSRVKANGLYTSVIEFSVGTAGENRQMKVVADFDKRNDFPFEKEFMITIEK